MATTNWLDNLISFVSPQAGARRVRWRKYSKEMARAYDGASKGKRLDGWKATGKSANAETLTSLAALRDRSRDLVRNNPYAARGLQVITANTVGTGIIPYVRAKNSGQAEKIKATWESWGESRQCDADGVHDFYGLQSLVKRTIVESGEVLVRRRKASAGEQLSVPLQIQVLEPDFLDSKKNEELKSGRIIQGIEFDANGKRVAYYLFTKHPGDGAGGESVRVPAEDIIHVFRRDRPGQVRGVPWFAPVIIRLRDLDEYEDYQLVKQKISSCFAGFVQDLEAPTDPTTAAEEFKGQIEAGTFQFLPPGKTVTFPNPPSLGGYSEHTKQVLHAVAVGLGVTFESLTGDFSNVNFSSGRMGWLEFQRNIEEWRWKMIIPGFCIPVWTWFAEAATLKGVRSEGATVGWTPPRREMIDPTREIPAMVTAIRSGLNSLSNASRELGNDPDQLLSEIASDAKKLDSFGIILDSDPRKTSKAGFFQVDKSAEESADAEDDEADTESDPNEEATK